MFNLSNSSASHNSNVTTPSTGTDHAGWRAFWQAEAEANGFDWRGLVGLHFDVCNRLQAAWVSS